MTSKKSQRQIKVTRVTWWTERLLPTLTCFLRKLRICTGSWTAESPHSSSGTVAARSKTVGFNLNNMQFLQLTVCICLHIWCCSHDCRFLTTAFQHSCGHVCFWMTTSPVAANRLFRLRLTSQSFPSPVDGRHGEFGPGELSVRLGKYKH